MFSVKNQATAANTATAESGQMPPLPPSDAGTEGVAVAEGERIGVADGADDRVSVNVGVSVTAGCPRGIVGRINGTTVIGGWRIGVGMKSTG